MSGRVGDLTPEQQDALTKFKEQLKDVLQPLFDDNYLLKWLRARSFDLNKAEAMLRNHIAWRKEHNVDNITSWKPPDVLLKYYPGGLFGYTKKGLPIWIEPAGQLDPKGLLYSCKKTDIIKFKIRECELIQAELKAHSKRLGRIVDNIVVICDFESYGLRHFWRPALEIFKEILKIFEPHYPETVCKTYIINANRFFSVLFNIGKPFLSEDTRSKVVMLGSNWRRELLEDISADQLPVKWGGTRVDENGDTSCSSKICLGGLIPEIYRLPKHLLYDDATLTKATVGRGAKLQVEYTTTIPHCILMYQFYTESHDIGFGVYRKTENDKTQKLHQMEQIYSTHRVNSHMVQEDGSVTLTTPGTYVVVFDNSFSWVTSKKVVYTVHILPPYDVRDFKHSSSYELPDKSDVTETTPL